MTIENEDLNKQNAEWKVAEKAEPISDQEPSEDLTSEFKEKEKKIPVPIYKPMDQFTVDQLQTEYPEWANHYNGDAELTAINYERTRTLRKIGQETGVGGSILLQTGGEGLKWAIDATPKEVGLTYDAHGISGKQDAVMELDKLLKQGIQKDRQFYSMNFISNPEAAEGFGAERPFTTGGFIAVSEHGEKLVNSGIKYVVVGEEYNRVLDILKNRYPQVTFLPWHEAPAYLTAKASLKEGKKIPCEEMTEKNRPYYHVAETFPFQRNIDSAPIGDAPSTSSIEGDVW